MNGKMSEFEVMAPVGSRESLAAAIQAGADSVYFGVGRLNMRAGSASAFTLDDLKEIADTCHKHGIKSYLTVNTIIYDDDMEEMRQTLSAACEAEDGSVWESNLFGKTLGELVSERLNAKLTELPEEARMKLRRALERIVNEGANGLICLVL